MGGYGSTHLGFRNKKLSVIGAINNEKVFQVTHY